MTRAIVPLLCVGTLIKTNMAVEYKSLVLNSLQQCQYPILKDFVVMDIHYQVLPENTAVNTIYPYDRRLHDPLHVWKRNDKPFQFSYLSGNQHMVYVHETDTLSTQALPIDCIRVKLSRCHLDTLQNQTSVSFEEELLHFIQLLNFDPSKLAPFLDMDIMTCTRLLPQFIRMWVYKYETALVKSTPIDKDLLSCFGPSEHSSVIPVRVLNGHLSPCTSSSVILSLNDNVKSRFNYLQHYSDRFQAVFPLAYNPLENPLIIS